MRKNILITGVHGYIGNALKDKLIEQGHQVDQLMLGINYGSRPRSKVMMF